VFALHKRSLVIGEFQTAPPFGPIIAYTAHISTVYAVNILHFRSVLLSCLPRCLRGV